MLRGCAFQQATERSLATKAHCHAGLPCSPCTDMAFLPLRQKHLGPLRERGEKVTKTRCDERTGATTSRNSTPFHDGVRRET